MRKAFMLAAVLVLALGLIYAWADQPNISKITSSQEKTTEVSKAPVDDQSQLEAEKAAEAGIPAPEATSSDKPTVIVKPTGRSVDANIDRTTNFSDLKKAQRLQKNRFHAEKAGF
jgi:hypothetical protein